MLLFSVTVFAARQTVPSKVNFTSADIARKLNGIHALVLKDPDSARKLAEHTLLMSKRINYGPGIGKSFYEIATSYWAQAFVPVSQFYLNLALPYLKNNPADLAECYTSMARNYVDLKMYDAAQRYYNNALKLVANDNKGKASVYTDYTALFSTKGDYDKCLLVIDTALKYNRLINNNQAIAILHNRLGEVYLGQGKLDKAAVAFDTCYRRTAQTQNKRLLTSTLIFQARVALAKKNYKHAHDLAEQGYTIADDLGSVKFKQGALRVLTDIYEEKKDYKSAFEIQQQRLNLKRSTDRIANERSLELVQDYARLSKKLNEIEVVNKKNHDNETQIKQQHRTIALLGVLLFAAVAILGIIYFFYKQNHTLNNQLQQQHQTLINQKQFIEMQHADLESVNRLKDKLLTIIGHDLRTPIANISSIANMFATGLISHDEVQKLMTDMVPVLRGAELTLANLTDFAGNQIKGKKVNTKRFDICHAIAECEEVFRHQLKQKSITFMQDCTMAFFVKADESQVKVVLRNLISNAIKFTNARGQITVTMQELNNEAIICVDDTGVGISEEKACKLFSYNEHFSEKGTMGEQGTGMGLLLCKELVTLNGGRIWVDTQKEMGCKVCFTLPMAD